ncbi:hypothetical protein QFZ96_007476 [Paraburkholderia youngii]
MFLIQPENVLPLQSAVAGADVCAVAEQWTPGDLLVLRVASTGAREMPSVIWMDLTAGAGSLDQFVDGEATVRGAALVSTRLSRPAEEWYLEPLSEIRIGATEFSEQDRKLFSVTQFTTAAGRKFSVPYAVATRPARGRRVWRAKAQGAQANC